MQIKQAAIPDQPSPSQKCLSFQQQQIQKCCRICLSTDQQQSLISPCKCNGTMKYIHRKCIERWINENENMLNYNYITSTYEHRCQLCHMVTPVISYSKWRLKTKQQMAYYMKHKKKGYQLVCLIIVGFLLTGIIFAINGQFNNCKAFLIGALYLSLLIGILLLVHGSKTQVMFRIKNNYDQYISMRVWQRRAGQKLPQNNQKFQYINLKGKRQYSLRYSTKLKLKDLPQKQVNKIVRKQFCSCLKKIGNYKSSTQEFRITRQQVKQLLAAAANL